MANGHPILVLSYESDTWICYFSFAHFVCAILNVDPPLTAVRAAQIPLVTSVDSFCLRRLKAAAHGIEHLLRRGILLCRRSSRRRAKTDSCDNYTDYEQRAELSYYAIRHFVIHFTICHSCFVILMAS